ncbi:ABC transporter substrate-binding protein [Paramaledivibacter caminithermalis]|jgi:peptide/nickel transport system substrate-binding protein/oligopeptide transport system substrate-binding protein|uniref:Oligopeptide transport system substrate-binding protein n=1 Tax=Paramaledivibacter caminithermalis (strain DSM 15212 / CIP 107654 / DViRD3) TaxID=1121301 RepID=A0A1M6PV59_PARC5|nr:ABC transporter substrate-binding protein [Paramaledivibacter caminithermalis]SHK11829.1 oligopeptide transport system substrate-binding protein [Paramaledivibacter caminithermalis DSM 15212]
MVKRKNKIYTALILLLVLALVFSGCGKSNEPSKEAGKTSTESAEKATTNETESSSGEPKYGGIFRSYLGNDLKTLDPAFATAEREGKMVSLLYDSLVKFDVNGKVIPSLAKSWETPDDSTLIFHLVDNAKFHNGNPFTAQDVKYSFERILDPEVGSPRTWVFEKVKGAKDFMEGKSDSVEGIEVSDDYTVKITLEQPFAPFLSMLGMPAAHIVDKNEIEKYPDQKDYAFNPVGTGPFKFVEYSNGDKFVIEANEDYFSGRPYIDGVNYRIIQDESTAVAEFEAGNLDELDIPTADIDRLKNNPAYAPYILTSNTFWNFYIGLTFNKEPFNDIRVRKAFCYAIDREAIINTVKRNAGVVSNGPIPPGLDGYREGLNPYPYNIDKAKELLAEAGYSEENPCSFELWHSDSKTNVALLEPIQAMLNQAGFKAKLVAMEWNSYKAAVRAGEAQAFYLSWGADYPDAENYLYPLFHSSMSGGGGNETRYNNPEFDKIIEQAQRTSDYDERIKLYQKAEDITIEDAARLWLYLSKEWLLYRPEVKGAKIYRIFNADKLLDIWLDR